MTQLRRDPIVSRWVAVDVNNPLGPNDFEHEDHSFKQEATCQFCLGREHLTPPEVSAIRPANTRPNTPGWSVRVVPNKFPALQLEGEVKKFHVGVYELTSGIGAHEVLIETPDHHKNLADFNTQEMAGVIEQYRSRCDALSKDPRFKYVLIFKNYGGSAGATVEHAHSQIIALPMVPKYVLEEIEGAESYYRANKRCVFCDVMAQEQNDQERIVSENAEFIAFVPFAGRYPFEVWIMPKVHSCNFRKITRAQENGLGETLKDVLSRLKKTLGDPSYNYYLHIAPTNIDNVETQNFASLRESFHWHIEIIPKLTRPAGFEWGTGLHVVPTPPDIAAKYLRE